MTKAREELEKIATKYEPWADRLVGALAASRYTIPIILLVLMAAVALGAWLNS